MLKGFLILVLLKGVASLSDIYSLKAVAMNTMSDPNPNPKYSYAYVWICSKQSWTIAVRRGQILNTWELKKYFTRLKTLNMNRRILRNSNFNKVCTLQNLFRERKWLNPFHKMKFDIAKTFLRGYIMLTMCTDKNLNNTRKQYDA